MLAKFKKIAVIGAGTMGIGIAEVVASNNHNVKLFDLDNEFAQAAKTNMSKRLASRVARGKITQQQRQQIEDNIKIVANLSELSDCQLVIEAIVENLAIKQKLFQGLQTICAANTLFASNTSSISITAIAAVLDKPANMLGLHFFNPAPVMQLVEVVAGLKTSQQNIKIGKELCELWHKIPVITQSTPGFIVNRVARSFYGEALKMLQEQVAAPVTIDALMTSAGFKMGPFALMDLIGIDVNLSVSQSVFASMYYDPRYKPSLIQQEMVAANLLGKKTGQGFYKYDGSDKPQVQFASKQTANGVISDNDFFTNLQNHQAIQIDDCAVLLSNGQTCQQRVKAGEYQHICHVDLMLDYQNCKIMHICFDDACPDSSKNKIVALIQSYAKQVIIGKDLPAQIVMRSVCMLINAAADAIENGVCSENDVDLAMQKGVNYPIGLIAWANKIGVSNIIEVLDNLQQWFGDDRYRISSYLRQ